MEIGRDKDHIHFFLHSVPYYSVTKLVTMIKSLTARDIFRRCPMVKNQLCVGEFLGKGYFVNTFGQHGTETMIAKYLKNQGLEQEYKV